MSDISGHVRGPILAVDFSFQGLGTCHSSGTIIALLLSLEEPFQRCEILVDVMKQFGITMEEIEDTYNDNICRECGVSTRMHKGSGGECP